jgi:hypothetical protein
MIDFNQYLTPDKEIMNISAQTLRVHGDSDAELNYLYFMRDEANRLIQKAKRDKKSEFDKMTAKLDQLVKESK